MNRPTNIDTERLRLVVLLPDEIEALLAGDNAFVSSRLECIYPPDDPSRGIDLSWHLRAMQANVNELPWRIRVIVERASNIVIGSINLKGPPSHGDVEIGWGLNENATGKGYAAEAAAAVTVWAFAQPDVASISATIPEDNIRSQRIAAKLGMLRTNEMRRNLPLWKVHRPEHLVIRHMNEDDPPIISAACQSVGWKKLEKQYRRYLNEQAAGTRTCLVADIGGHFVGYVTINWKPAYIYFAEQRIPEIQDLNVLPAFRRRGVGTRLLDQAEGEVARACAVVGIGVGLHPGYNAAQRLYVKRGYVPDGRGLTYKGRYVAEGEALVLDDDLVLYLTKTLRRHQSEM